MLICRDNIVFDVFWQLAVLFTSTRLLWCLLVVHSKKWHVSLSCRRHVCCILPIYRILLQT